MSKWRMPRTALASGSSSLMSVSAAQGCRRWGHPWPCGGPKRSGDCFCVGRVPTSYAVEVKRKPGSKAAPKKKALLGCCRVPSVCTLLLRRTFSPRPPTSAEPLSNALSTGAEGHGEGPHMHRQSTANPDHGLPAGGDADLATPYLYEALIPMSLPVRISANAL